MSPVELVHRLSPAELVHRLSPAEFVHRLSQLVPSIVAVHQVPVSSVELDYDFLSVAGPELFAAGLLVQVSVDVLGELLVQVSAVAAAVRSADRSAD